MFIPTKYNICKNCGKEIRKHTFKGINVCEKQLRNKIMREKMNLIGKIVTLKMKPTFLRDWVILRETKNCYVATKDYRAKGDPEWKPCLTYIPKKQITKIISAKKFKVKK